MSKKETNKLKPCPFCGGKAYVKEVDAGYYNRNHYADYRIGCESCGISFKDESTFIVKDGVPKITKDGYKNLIERWNKRVNKEEV